jgi:hypothetical protein
MERLCMADSGFGRSPAAYVAGHLCEGGWTYCRHIFSTGKPGINRRD